MGALVGGVGAFGPQAIAGLASAAGSVWQTNEAEKEAQAAREWSEGMSGSAHQREVADLKAAGLNPMLSAMHGGASTPGAAMAQPSGGNPVEAGFASASQAADVKLKTAAADKTEAETAEVKARTPTYAVTMDKLRQDISQSVEEINRIRAGTVREYASAGQASQQTENLAAMLPHIQASITQLQSLSKLNDAQVGQSLASAGLSRAETSKVMQLVRENLPVLERELKTLERTAAQLRQPGQLQDASVHDSFVGSLGAVLRALNPLNNFLK